MRQSRKIALIYHGNSAHVFEVSKFGRSEKRIRRHAFSGTHQDALEIARKMVAEGCDAKTGRCNVVDDVATGRWRFSARLLIKAGLSIVTTSGAQNRIIEQVACRNEEDLQSISANEINYEDYMRSQEWDARRKAAIIAAGCRCQICNAGNRRLDVHHRTYVRLGNELPQDLVALCRQCHKLFHQNRRLARY